MSANLEIDQTARFCREADDIRVQERCGRDSLIRPHRDGLKWPRPGQRVAAVVTV
jgi:hypothetical protein